MSSRKCLAGLFLLLLGSSAALAQSGGQQVCFGEYILCDAARCESDKKFENGEPIACDCRKPGPGLNIANSTCELRPSLSTYSLENINPRRGTPSKAWTCSADELIKNGKGWAFCLDAPCRRKDDGSEDWTCSCTYVDPEEDPSTMYTFGLARGAVAGSCEQDCNVNWSGATWSELLSGYSALATMHTEHIELNVCKAPSR